MSTRRRSDRLRGVGLVEFAIALPVLLLVIFGTIDFSRIIQANSTIAEAARQGARQAVANASADQPFGPVSGQCSGVVFSNSANGTGCLTDQAVYATVRAVLKDLTENTVLHQNTTAAACPTPTTANQANVCISPADLGTSSGVSYTDCNAATLALGHQPAPGDLGPRQAEMSSQQYRGCFLVQVTVKFAYQPMTPVITNVIGSRIQLVASTATVAEY